MMPSDKSLGNSPATTPPAPSPLLPRSISLESIALLRWDERGVLFFDVDSGLRRRGGLLSLLLCQVVLFPRRENAAKAWVKPFTTMSCSDPPPQCATRPIFSLGLIVESASRAPRCRHSAAGENRIAGTAYANRGTGRVRQSRGSAGGTSATLRRAAVAGARARARGWRTGRWRSRWGKLRREHRVEV